jgi:hypothetical protein
MSAEHAKDAKRERKKWEIASVLSFLISVFRVVSGQSIVGKLPHLAVCCPETTTPSARASWGGPSRFAFTIAGAAKWRASKAMRRLDGVLIQRRACHRAIT